MSNPSIYDTINAAYKQWAMMGDGSGVVEKAEAYESTVFQTEIDDGMDCHFCDYDQSKDSGTNCESCPAFGLWSKKHEGSYAACSCSDDSPYAHWERTRETALMLDLIKRTAEKHGVTLESSA